ncbi:MAG: metal ABC transporter ATP-binding protein [Pirellulales bacterium]|jgi:manganese/zinc/iron transport system ATP- binding protein|nr:metal ABC transporter ATP-binding protein [Pirellulales bacterium]HJN66584.1 metal ABC transporter ATP-binding protein [Pirellulales bacterium]
MASDAGSTIPLHARNLTVSFADRAALRSISFQLQSGTLTGIIGPNGAGKSTLLRALLGLLPLDAGNVKAFGLPVAKNRQRIAYVPQKQTVDWDFPVTVLDVVLMGRYGRSNSRLWRLLRRPGETDRLAAEQALAQLGMSDFKDRHIRQLSGGQQQRVFLARALCQEADILLLDEPLTGVDVATEEIIFSLIDKLTAAGKTLLLVSHDLSILDRLHQVMLLNRRIIAIGPPEQAATKNNLRQTYGGRLALLDQAEAALTKMK